MKKKTVMETLICKGGIFNLGLFIQLILLIISIILLIMMAFIPELNLVVESTLALLLFTIAYNNHTIYKRKYLTFIYILAGILVIGANIISVVYGI